MSIEWVENAGYTAIVRGTYLGKNWVNRFCVVPNVVANPNESVTAFVDAFYDAWGEKIVAAQNNGVQWQDVVVSHESKPEEGTFVDSEIHTGGVTRTAAEYSPSSLAFSFRLFTSLGISRSGWKRFVGLTEDHLSGNTIVDGDDDYLGTLGEIRDALTTPFTTVGGNTFACAVLMHNFPGYPLLAIPIVSAEVIVRVATQNSRK